MNIISKKVVPKLRRVRVHVAHFMQPKFNISGFHFVFIAINGYLLQGEIPQLKISRRLDRLLGTRPTQPTTCVCVLSGNCCRC